MDAKFLAVIMVAIFFLVAPTPEITSVLPNTGLNTEMVTVTIEGKKFEPNVMVRLTKNGDAPIEATEINIISKTKLTGKFNLQGKTAGKWDVVIANIDKITKKEKTAVLKEGFTIEGPSPMIKGIDPKSAYNNGTLALTITGTNFRPGAAVQISNQKLDVGATNIEVVSSTKISCSVNLSGVEPGLFNVKVTNDDGKSSILKDGLTVTAPPAPVIKKPSLTGIAPNFGFNNSYVLIAVSGANFENGTTLKLIGPDGTVCEALNIKVTSSAKIDCFFDIRNKPEGLYDLEVTNLNGQKALLPKSFTVQAYVPGAKELNDQLKPIYFDLNKFNIRANQAPVLEADLKVLKANPKLYILLGGHADERGSREYNLDLSAKRGNTIKDFLVAGGIDPARINIFAYGEDYPVIKGKDEAAWSQNRRVEIMLWEAPPTKEQGIPGR